MRTFPASSSKPGAAPAGFTIIELMLVLTLLVLVMTLAVPTFQSVLQDSLDKEVARLGGVIRLARNEAILTRKSFRILFDLKASSYAVEEEDQFGRFLPRDDPKLFRPYTLPDSIELKNLFVYGSRFDLEYDKKVPIVINVSGFVDPFSLQFLQDGQPWTIVSKGFMAKMSLEPGLIELKAEDR